MDFVSEVSGRAAGGMSGLYGLEESGGEAVRRRIARMDADGEGRVLEI